MKTLKRASALMIAVMLLMSIVALPASALSNYDIFYHFPLVTKSMGSGYMSAAVAIQKFLLLYSPISYNQINANGGTDGYFGNGSANATQYFQGQEGLGVDGKVGSLTWMKIGELLFDGSGVDSLSPYYWYPNNSNAYIEDSYKMVIILLSGRYCSVDRYGTAKEPFYPI